MRLPEERVKLPDIVSPALSTFDEAAPVTLPETFPERVAVIVPALKFPAESRFTSVFTALLLVPALASNSAV